MENTAINIATAFLKKTFCITGTSPASLINNVINEKQNAEAMIQIIPI
jgi:hypothetical protein